MINELSFIGQAENNYDEADNLMTAVFEIIEEFKKIDKGIPVRIHSNFWTCRISQNLTVREWLQNKQKLEGKKNNQVSLFLEITWKGPFIDHELEDKLKREEIAFFKCEFHEKDVSKSSLAGVIYFQIYDQIMSKIISLPKAPAFSKESLKIKFTTDGKYHFIEIPNFNDVSQAKKLLPKYEASQKHEPGGHGTLMNLSKEDAKEVFNESYRNNWFEGKQYYGYKNGKFYEFQPDNVGGYHGYPVERKEVPSRVLKKMKL
ncbi:hypothetical protein [Planktothrix paucivesiculata]|uniref:hypothetical protein n=1 Tax=Planktothrix paucivesiculata TaxID=1678308 RepID=UPI0012DD4E5E|nr:hypothetical protein [Planktothrix paucivesiculata]